MDMDENEYTRNLIKQSIKQKIEKQKEKLINKLFKTKKKDEIEELKAQLKDLDKECEKEILLFEENIERKSIEKMRVFEAFDDEGTDDNAYSDYIKKLNRNVEKLFNNVFNDEQRKNIIVNKIKKENVKRELNSIFTIIRENAYKIEDLFVPNFLWNMLFDYQKITVEWLYKLYKKEEGGILADEMGLGKTLQVISFLSSMYISNKINYTLIVSPTTIIDQWIIEWKKFFPFVRICVLHKSHTNDINKLLSCIKNIDSVVIISYNGFKMYKRELNRIKFDYIILDEGHKIKNKDSGITKEMKEFSCKNRIVLTGTPIQNNLKELWAIFDFINPGKLGSFADFCEEYEEPINRGHFSNANKFAIEKSYKRTVLLRNLIDPYILRRLKSQVAAELPSKKDKVIFCNLTQIQEKLYKKELDSDYVYKILTGKLNCMGGLIVLRKICNHPFLYESNHLYMNDILSCSIKMQKVAQLLYKWKSENKKVLIFTQMIEMLNIIENYLKNNNYTYLTMSGKTSIKLRAHKISQFNTDENIFIFLLTTKVGGLGLNLIGASRIIIYDPDWNPSTDSQAKERAWRYGQKNEVETYRLITMNTIEEKMFQRQIFKNLLSNKILQNPKLSKLFAKDDITDLFSYYKANKEEREEIIHFDEEHDEEDLFNGKIDNDLKDKMNFLRNKELLDDNEMIEFIIIREEQDM